MYSIFSIFRSVSTGSRIQGSRHGGQIAHGDFRCLGLASTTFATDHQSLEQPAGGRFPWISWDFSSQFYWIWHDLTTVFRHVKNQQEKRGLNGSMDLIIFDPVEQRNITVEQWNSFNCPSAGITAACGPHVGLHSLGSQQPSIDWS